MYICVHGYVHRCEVSTYSDISTIYIKEYKIAGLYRRVIFIKLKF